MTQGEKGSEKGPKKMTSFMDDAQDRISPKFKIQNLDNTSLTKRNCLSILAKFYDSLGLMSPFFVTPKLLIQRIWATDREMEPTDFVKSWDQQVRPDIEEEFKAWNQGLKRISKISFPRFSGFDEKAKQELYAYADASVKAIRAAVYLRTIPPIGKAQFTLLLAKGHTAPLPPPNQSEKIAGLTIPRLELASAQMAVKLIKTVREAWKLSKNFPVKTFVDSEIVLAMISGYKIREPYYENRLRLSRARH